MTKTSRAVAVAAASAALLLSLAACASADPAPTESAADADAGVAATVAGEAACEGDEGVTVVVDASAFGDADDVSAAWCVFADETVGAADALVAAQVTTEGTDEYGDQVVCRVNGLPSETEPVGSTEDPAYVEACESMPAAFAYWSLWVKPAGGEWDYAQEGLSTLQLEPGDAVELLFTLDGEPAAPTS